MMGVAKLARKPKFGKAVVWAVSALLFIPLFWSSNQPIFVSK
jgi:hypothetical protein